MISHALTLSLKILHFCSTFKKNLLVLHEYKSSLPISLNRCNYNDFYYVRTLGNALMNQALRINGFRTLSLYQQGHLLWFRGFSPKIGFFSWPSTDHHLHGSRCGIGILLWIFSRAESPFHCILNALYDDWIPYYKLKIKMNRSKR